MKAPEMATNMEIDANAVIQHNGHIDALLQLANRLATVRLAQWQQEDFSTAADGGRSLAGFWRKKPAGFKRKPM